MAKKKSFGENNKQKASSDGPMAKVILSNKLGNNRYSFKEKMVREENVKEYINENRK